MGESKVMYKGEEQVASFLAKKGSATIEEIASNLNLSLDAVRKLVESLREQGFVRIEKKEKDDLSTTEEFGEYRKSGVLPEFSVFKKAFEGKGIADLDERERKYGIGWARKKGYIEIENGILKPTKDLENVKKENDAILNIFDRLNSGGNKPNPEELEELFRRGFIKAERRFSIIVSWLGKEIPKGVSFDVTAEGPDAALGKPHPLTKFENRIKQIFVELGFEEMDGSIIESSFWNFDALFQPQDHPARDLADTFYLKGECALPCKELVSRVKKAHEKGWKYKWSEKEAKRRVLRTHTTALSARTLATLKDPSLPKKYFAIGRVFRNEATDATHLAEFYQVEGIIAWENATFRNLLGILKEFYNKLGFEKVRFRPSYFPYTEPSLEIEVFLEKKGQWLEMGGAGIFRPEVSIPLAKRYPVLAWGLSLERPLMLLLELSDIRTLYKNDINFLKSARI